MKILTDTLLFNMFTSYLVSATPIVNELPVAYKNLMKQLRRLNYTKIELTFIQSASEKMADGRHVLYDVFIGKTLALLDAEIEMIKEMFRYGSGMEWLKPEVVNRAGKKVGITLNWNGTDSDLIELVAALMAAGAVTSAEGRKLTVIDVIRVFEDMFHLKINALYTKRGKVFDRCTDTTPFIDSLRVSYNRMLEKRLS